MRVGEGSVANQLVELGREWKEAIERRERAEAEAREHALFVQASLGPCEEVKH